MEAGVRLRLPATLDSLEAFRAMVAGYARDHGMEPAALSAVELALEEALVNIASYAYPQAAGEAEVSCTFEGDRLVLEIMDWGVAFDPSAAANPEGSGSLEERQIGGLGIHLMKRAMDEVRYRRDHGCNHLTLVKVKRAMRQTR